MPAKRSYNVRAAKDFIVLAGVFFFLCLWAVKDAWYPSPGVLKKHPLSVDVSFEQAGTVSTVHVAVGDTVAKDQVLAELGRTRMEVELEEAKKKFSAAKETYASSQEKLSGATDGERAQLKDAVLQAKSGMDAELEKVKELSAQLESTDLISSSKGEVLELRIGTHSLVEVVEATSSGEISGIVDGVITTLDSEGNATEYTISDDMHLKATSGDHVSKGDVLASETVMVLDPKDHFYVFNKSLAIISFIAFWIFLALHFLAT